MLGTKVSPAGGAETDTGAPKSPNVIATVTRSVGADATGQRVGGVELPYPSLLVDVDGAGSRHGG